MDTRKVIATYGFDASELIKTGSTYDPDTYRIFSTQHYTVGAFIDKGLLNSDLGINVFIAFDELLNSSVYDNLLHELTRENPGFEIRENATPLAYVPADTEFNAWLRGVKTSPSYYRGQKFCKQNIVEETILLNDLKQHRDVQSDVELKCRKFSKFSIQLLFNAFCIFAKGENIKIQRLVSTVDGIYLWSALYATLNGVTYCPFIVHVADETLNKTYKPIIVGHIEVVRRSLPTRIEFGLFFDYKSLLNFSVYYLKGIHIKS